MRAISIAVHLMFRSIVFLSILALLRPFCSVYFLSSISVVLEKELHWRIFRHLLLCGALSKCSKVSLHNVYLVAFNYFGPGIMRFDRPIIIKPGFHLDFLCLSLLVLVFSCPFWSFQLRCPLLLFVALRSFLLLFIAFRCPLLLFLAFHCS